MRPCTWTAPSEGCSTPQMSCNKEDLPAPLTPTTPSTSPRLSSKDTALKDQNSGEGLGA